MARFERWFDQDLSYKLETRHTQSISFSEDNLSVLLGVRLYENGAPVSVSGSVVCYAIRNDGNTVVFSGSLSSNQAYAVLPKSCFVSPGPLAVMLQLVTGTGDNAIKTTVLKVLLMVEASQTGTIIDPGSEVPDLSDLLAMLDQMEAATTAANTAAAHAMDTVLVSETQPQSEYNKLWIVDDDADEYTVPTYNEFEDLKSAIDDSFVSNNLLPLADYDITYYGVHISVKNGIMTLKGTSTAYIRCKVSNGYDAKGSVQNSWKNESLPQFEVGKTYSIHNQIISGTKTEGVGVSLRDSDGSSVVSVSNPEVTLSGSIAFAMLYIPINTEVDFSYVPMFIEGGVNDHAYYKGLNSYISVTGVKSIFDAPDKTETFIYDSNLESAIKFPANYTDTGNKTPLIVLCHGLSSTISASNWGNADMINLVTRFTDSGFAVLDVNQVTQQDWINPALIKKYIAAIKDAENRYYIQTVAIFGESMGGLIGLCLSTLLNVKVCAISGLRLDFLARYNAMTAAQKAVVDENLGFTDGYDAFATAGYDKTVFPSVDSNGDNVCNTQFVPTLFVVGDEDTYNEVSLVKVTEIKRGGTITDTKTYSGNHNAVCYLKTGTSFDDVIAWFDQWLT